MYMTCVGNRADKTQFRVTPGHDGSNLPCWINIAAGRVYRVQINIF
jgi:hypothetical protein